MNFNSNAKFSFNGGDLISDAGLLLLKEFEQQIAFNAVVSKHFDTAKNIGFRKHLDGSMLTQKIYQTISGYFTDDMADELNNDVLFRN